MKVIVAREMNRDGQKQHGCDTGDACTTESKILRLTFRCMFLKGFQISSLQMRFPRIRVWSMIYGYPGVQTFKVVHFQTSRSNYDDQTPNGTHFGADLLMLLNTLVRS